LGWRKKTTRGGVRAPKLSRRKIDPLFGFSHALLWSAMCPGIAFFTNPPNSRKTIKEALTPQPMVW
jgi:hypothetical protein